MWLYEPSALLDAGSDLKSRKKNPFFKQSGIFVFGGLKGHLTVTDPNTMAQKKCARKP